MSFAHSEAGAVTSGHGGQQGSNLLPVSRSNCHFFCTVSSDVANILTWRYMQDEEKALETLVSKRSALQGKRTELERKIKDLGSLPSEAFEKFQDHTVQELHKLLQKANAQLKKFRFALHDVAHHL